MPLPPRLLELKRALREKWLYVHPAGTSEPAPLLTRFRPRTSSPWLGIGLGLGLGLGLG